MLPSPARLAAPPSSISLLDSARSVCFTSISPSPSSYASHGQSLSLLLLLLHLSQQASLFTLARPLPFIRLTNKVESKHPHRYTHAHANMSTHILVYGFTDLDRSMAVGCHLLAYKKNNNKTKGMRRHVCGAQQWISAFLACGQSTINSFVVNVIMKVSVSTIGCIH